MQLKRVLILLGVAASLWAQYPTAIDTDATLLVANDLAQATLSADMDADDTSFTVSSASNFSANMVVKIDNEQIKCAAWNSGTRTFSSCTRGYGFPTATTPASHSATGANCSDAPWPGCVRGIIASAHQRTLKEAIINIQTALGASLANVYAPTAAIDYSGAASTRPWKVGTTLPSTCVTGQGFFKSDATAGQNIYLCTSTDTWTQVQTPALSSTQTGVYEKTFTSETNLVIPDSEHGLHACPATITLAIDNSGTWEYHESYDLRSCIESNYTVTVDFGTATSGKLWLVRGSGAAAGGLPGQVQTNVSGTLGGLSGSTASGSTLTMTGLLSLIGGRLIPPHGPTKPATCTVGEFFIDDDETPAGQQVYVCSATDTWSKVGDGGSGGGGGTIDAATGKGLYATRVDGIQTFNIDPSVVAMQGKDNTFRGTNEFNAGSGNFSLTAANDTSTGTETYKLVSKSGVNIIRSTTSSSDWSVGICTDDCGTSGSGVYVFRGYTTCVFDNATTAGNWVVRSTTDAGKCHDSGVVSSSGTRPASGFVAGISAETAGSAGNRIIEITGADFR